MSDEIRWYKGKYKVRIIQKSNVKGNHRPRNVMVEALEDIPFGILLNPEIVKYWKSIPIYKSISVGEHFTTVPRLLWRHPRK